MVQATGTTGIILLAAALSAAPGRAGPVSGVFTGPLGRIVFETEGRGRVVGRSLDGGPCKFDVRRPVLDGELEGDVLVGTVALCQTGPACEERAYSILAFRLSDGSLSAQVKLEPGCQSSALDGTRLVLHPVPGQAAELVSDKPSKTTNAECAAATAKGYALSQKGDWAGVIFYFSKGLACNDRLWQKHFAIGVAEIRRGNIDAALASLNRARALSSAEGPEDPVISFNMACAYAQIGEPDKALQAMARAVDLGWMDPKAMADDPDLKPLRELPEFKALVDRAWDLKEKAPVKEDHP